MGFPFVGSQEEELMPPHSCKEQKPGIDQDALMPKLLSSFQIPPSDYCHHGERAK